jgi:hypothetical protein
MFFESLSSELRLQDQCLVINHYFCFVHLLGVQDWMQNIFEWDASSQQHVRTNYRYLNSERVFLFQSFFLVLCPCHFSNGCSKEKQQQHGYLVVSNKRLK